MPNQFMPIGQGTSPEAATNQINQNFAKLDAEAVTKTFNGPNGTQAVIQGRLPNDLGYGMLLNDASGMPLIYMAVDQNGLPVMKVAKTGYDATTASDDQLVFNSAQNVFKVVDTGNLSMPAQNVPNGDFITRSAAATFTAQSSTPVVIAYGRRTTNNDSFVWGGVRPGATIISGAGGGVTLLDYEYLTMDITTSSVTFNAETSNGRGSNFDALPYTITYYVLQESISG
jgi:hypothetical protein